MNVLILGGTIFLGRALIESLQRKGYNVSIFHRGNNPLPSEYQNVKEYIGNRNTDLENIGEQEWDAVIDTCGYTVKQVRNSAGYFRNRTSQYIFISSISVYKSLGIPNQDEESDCGTLDNPETEEITGETYGPLKRYCEIEVENVFQSNACILRPGLIVGKHDNSHRFTYWIHRVLQGGEILVPNTWNSDVQFIDVNDISDFVVNCISKKQNGTFNLNSPPGKFTLRDIVETSARLSEVSVQFIEVSEEFLISNNVGAWIEFPLWIPISEDTQGFYSHSVQKAIDSGLTISQLEQTISKIIQQLQQNQLQQLRAGLSPVREKELITLWNNPKSTAL